MSLSLIPVAISFLLLPMYPESPPYLRLYRHNKDEATRDTNQRLCVQIHVDVLG